MPTQKITLSLPTSLVEQLKARVPPTAGIWSDEDYPEFATEEDIDRWLRESRASWTTREFPEA